MGRATYSDLENDCKIVSCIYLSSIVSDYANDDDHAYAYEKIEKIYWVNHGTMG